VRVPENKPSSTTKPPEPRSLPRPSPAAPLTRQEDALGKELIGYGPESFEPIDTDFGNQPKRTWSDYTNKYALMGRLKSLTKDSSVNLNNDAQKFSVKYSRLSNADMKYIDSEKLRMSRMGKDDKEWDELQGKRREAYGDDYVDRNYKFDNLNLRDWTDISGKYTTKAKLVSTFQDSATLQKENDKQVNLPISKLSRMDSDYVYRMIQAKRRDIKMDKFEAEYNAATGNPDWGYNEAGLPVKMDRVKVPDTIGEFQFDPVTGRVMSGDTLPADVVNRTRTFGPRPSSTFRVENGRIIDTTKARDVKRGGSYRVQKARTPEQKAKWEQENPEQMALNRENMIKRARVALSTNGKRKISTKASAYYAKKLGFDPSITEADLYNELDKLRAQQNPIQPINKQFGGLINYLVDGGSAYDRRKNDPIARMLNNPSSNTRILDESARSRPKRPTFDLNPTDPLFGIGVMSDDPGESLGKIMKLPGVSHLFDIFDAASSILTGAISVTGGALGKVIAGNNKSEFSDALNKTSDNEIERGKAKLEAAFLHIAKLYDDTTGGTYWTSQLETNAATQEKLYKEKIAFASANGRAWEVTMADDFSAILSNVAAGNYLGKGVAKSVASVNKLSKTTDVIPRPGAATSTNILASIVNSPAFTKAGLIADNAGKIKDGIEGLNNLSEQLSENKQSSNQSKSNVYSGPIIKDGAPAVVNYNTGGHVAYASNGQLINFQPKGTDTVPAMLTPGEFVINRAATQKHLPVLQAINSGSYSHGDIVKQFNKGGSVLPNYYMNGNSVSAGTNSNSFDFGSFMRELMGQLSSVLTESIRKAYDSNNQQNVSEKSNGVSIDKSILDSINTFTNRLKSVADILAGLNSIPSEIRITGQHDVNVIINGDSVLRQLNPDIQQIVMTAMKDGFQKLINNNSPVPADKLINPFNIEGPTQL
jgi:hypothetical protein